MRRHFLPWPLKKVFLSTFLYCFEIKAIVIFNHLYTNECRKKENWLNKALNNRKASQIFGIRITNFF